MLTEAIKIISIPFLGTALGAATVFIIKRSIDPLFQKCMNGFAAGIMIAASVWSLIIPAIELSEERYGLPVLPALIGLWFGKTSFFITDKLLFSKRYKYNIDNKSTNRHTLTILAVAIHNVPEGMALGVLLAAWLMGSEAVTLSSVLALAIGIGVQNFPEGSIISVPLYAAGMKKRRAFRFGIISAVAELIGTVITLLCAPIIVPLLPYLMCFAAGAMIYVVIGELCPEMSEGDGSDIAIMMFSVGFSLMMALDVMLG